MKQTPQGRCTMSQTGTVFIKLLQVTHPENNWSLANKTKLD